MGILRAIRGRLFVVAAALALIVLFLPRFLSLSVLHSSSEISIIILSFSIFAVTWNARRFQNNSYLTFMGMAFLFITGLTAFNELRIDSLENIAVFPPYEFREMSIEKVISRHIMGFSLLFAPLLLRRKLKSGIIFSMYGMLLLLLLAPVLYWRISPESLVREDGFTPLGIVNEYIVLFVLLGSVAHLLRYRKEFDPGILQLLIISTSVAIASKTVFTINTGQSESLLLTGQFLQLISFYLFYVAFVETGLTKPHNLLFRDLKQREEAFAGQARDLATANQKLEEEIGERKQIEHKLAASEVRYRRLFETAQDGVLILDAKTGQISDANPALEKMVGYAKGEFLGKELWQMGLFKDIESNRHALSQLQAGGSSRCEDLPLVTRDRGVIPVELVSSIYSANGSRVVQCNIRDITRRKQGEEAQKSQWEMLINMLDTLETRVYISNRENEIEYINPMIAGKYGPPAGRKCYEYFHGRTAICSWCRNKDVFAGKTTRWELNSDTTGKTYDVIATPIRNAAGTISRLAILHDITEQKQAASQIQLQTRILSNVKDAVTVLDEHHRIVTWNRAAEAIFGWKEDEIVGKPVADVFHSELLNSESAESVSTEVMQYRRDGTPVWVDSSFFVVQNSAGEVTGYVCLLRDVTERVRSEKALKTSEERYRDFSRHLEQAREQERQFIAREIHDEFGQILTALKWDLCLLDKDGPGDDEHRVKCMQSMSGLIDAATTSIQSVTERLRPTQLDNLGLGPAIEWHTAEFQKRTRIRCKLSLGDGINSVQGDRAIAVFRVLQEALTNIARHSQATDVEISFEKDEDRFLLTVRDNGKGITADQKSDVRSFGLMGMRERARSCEGEIEISGVEGEGTTVRLSIPAVHEEDTSDKSSCR